MDEIVKAAMLKWPKVPHCHGWLALSARGDWFMRDDRVQAAGPFPRVKGSRIEHPKLLAFIERNYLADDAGGWYFQNGPQRVYVDLEAAPWVWRLTADAQGGAPALQSHTGADAVPRGCWLDEGGRLFIDCDLGFGIVHTQDMTAAADAVERGLWVPGTMPFGEMPARFRYRLVPRPGP
jgi:hypothetical protein